MRHRNAPTQLRNSDQVVVEKASTPDLYMLLTTGLGRLASSRPGEFTFYDRQRMDRFHLEVAKELRKRGDQLRLV